MFVILFALLALLTPAMAQDAIPQEVITQEDVMATPATTTAQPLTDAERQRINSLEDEIRLLTQQMGSAEFLDYQTCEQPRDKKIQDLGSLYTSIHPMIKENAQTLWQGQRDAIHREYDECHSGYSQQIAQLSQEKQLLEDELGKLEEKAAAYQQAADIQAATHACVFKKIQEACDHPETWAAEKRQEQQRSLEMEQRNNMGDLRKLTNIKRN